MGLLLYFVPCLVVDLSYNIKYFKRIDGTAQRRCNKDGKFIIEVSEAKVTQETIKNVWT